MAKKQPEESPSSIDGVPTVAGLARRGRHLAYIRPDGRWHVTTEGHAVMQAALKANAQEAILNGEGDWVRPPNAGAHATGTDR